MARYLLPVGFLVVLIFLVVLNREEGKLSGMAKVIDGATLVVDGRRIRLHGLEPFPLGEMCAGSADTKPWACGREAAFRLSRLIDKRGVECEVTEAGEGQVTWARCRQLEKELSMEMLRAGLARTKDAGGLKEAEDQARQAGQGIWR